MKIWTGVITTRVAESREFYRRVFDAQTLYQGDDDWIVLLQIGDSELAFMQPGLESQGRMFRPCFDGKGVWLTFEVADAAAEQTRLQALGVPIAQALRDEPWGDRHFVVTDPNGVALDLVQRIV